MKHIPAYWVERPLDANQVFVRALAASQLEPFEPPVPLVLVSLDKIPPQDEVLGDVVNARPNDAHGDVVPGHAARLGLAQLVLLPVLDIFEVHDAVVVEVLAGPHLVRNTFRMHVRESMLVIVPAAKAEI